MKIILTAFISVFSYMAIAQDETLIPERSYTVILNNTCHRDISVAIHYLHPEKGWITQGWWEVEGRAELATDLISNHYQFYMHGTTSGKLQWPPDRTRKQYNRYYVQEDNFLLEEGKEVETKVESALFSLKEISQSSPGLKAKFDC